MGYGLGAPRAGCATNAQAGLRTATRGWKLGPSTWLKSGTPAQVGEALFVVASPSSPPHSSERVGRPGVVHRRDGVTSDIARIFRVGAAQAATAPSGRH
jgi:hypothetical protein